ncbi:MAG: molybdopterin-dependent oxidoreductase [Coriobacteriales bacterium]|jgi:DMSO/TMAO reductase YedYZ molybdopterin-dependent catalytic subunit
MMNDKSRLALTATGAAGIASALLLASGMAAAATADEATAPAAGRAAASATAPEAAARHAVDASRASFAWDQSTVTPNWYIRSAFAPAGATLCSATSAFATTDPMDWQVTVSGDVSDGYTATFEEMAKDQTVTQTMSCTCGGNPSDGRANVTAEVTGIPVGYMVSRAGADSDVNTITFVCDDGSEVSMPLAYVIGRHGVLTFDVNGEGLSESMGGTNQLWLAGTAGNYFVRNVTGIEVTHEDEVPASPSDDVHPNSPNVGLTSATA